jgi:small ubiquitin-related modifier
MAEAEDKKPDTAGADSETITSRVRDQTGEEVRTICSCPRAMPCDLTRFSSSQTFFKVKKTTRMEKVFNTYAQRKGVNQNSLRFLLDGERINADSSPASLDLEDQDQIDCMLEQQGGR